MLTTSPLTRAAIQSIRIRMAATGAGYTNAAEFHRALADRYDDAPRYDRVRRIWDGGIKRELPRRLLDQIAELTGFSLPWVAGDPNVELPASLNRVNPRYVKSVVGLMTYPPLLAAA